MTRDLTPAVEGTSPTPIPIIASDRKGRCIACSQAIEVGEEIGFLLNPWRKGLAAAHANCVYAAYETKLGVTRDDH